MQSIQDGMKTLNTLKQLLAVLKPIELQLHTAAYLTFDKDIKHLNLRVKLAAALRTKLVYSLVYCITIILINYMN